jgi:hypothetical protein
MGWILAIATKAAAVIQRVIAALDTSAEWWLKFRGFPGTA